MSKYPDRIQPEIVPDGALLPAQRALFELPKPNRDLGVLWMSPEGTRELGAVLAQCVPALMDATFEVKADTTQRDLDTHVFKKRQLGGLTNKLIRYGTPDDTDASNPEIRSHVRTKLEVLDDYDAYYRNDNTVFTPEGLVKNPPEDLRQRIVSVSAQHDLAVATETDWVSLGGSQRINLYTDNLSSSLPFVEFSIDSNGFNDIFPSGRVYEPYFFHAIPKRFVTEELALSVIESMAKVIAVNNATSQP